MTQLKYDWEMIQRDYDLGMSTRNLIEKYGMSSRTLTMAARKGRLKTRDASQSMTVRHKKSPMTSITKTKLRSIAKSQGLGGVTKGGGRGKKGWYKGIHCDSSWELAFILYCEDRGIMVTRCTEKRSYEFEGNHYTYYPDFVVDGEIIEIKGYNSPQWEAKYQANPDVKVLFHEQLKPILKHVVEKYGKNFTDLYETS